MKMNEASAFMRSLNRTPEENLALAVMTGKFPEDKPLSEKERMLLRRRIADIDEQLQEAMEGIAEAEGAAQRFLNAQPARNRVEEKLPRHLLDGLKKARALPKQLEHERKTLQKKIKDSLMAEQIQRQEEGEIKSATFSAKAKKFIESIGEKPAAADLVVEFAQALNGKSLESAFMPFLKAQHVFEDLEVERRHISEQHNITVDPLPNCPDLSYAPDLQAAIEKLLGKKIEIARNLRWRRVWANQRAVDRDAAAKRMGL